MATPLHESKEQPFPRERPEIIIAEMDSEPFSVNCQELKFRFIIPKPGEQAKNAQYSAPDWKHDGVEELRVVKPAIVHGIHGVEIEVIDSSVSTIYGCLTEDSVKYLATIFTERADGGEETSRLLTFLDEGFLWGWPEMPHLLEEGKRYTRQPDGSLKQAHIPENQEEICGAGIFSVKIGKREFACLRVIQPEGPVKDVDAPFHETYITKKGHTVLDRVYCHGCHEGIVVDENTVLAIDDETRFHWYDVLTQHAVGL